MLQPHTHTHTQEAYSPNVDRRMVVAPSSSSRISLSLSLSVLTAIFQVNLGFPGEPGCYGPEHPVFLQAGCHCCRPINSIKALKRKISHSIDLLSPSSPGGLPNGSCNHRVTIHVRIFFFQFRLPNCLHNSMCFSRCLSNGSHRQWHSDLRL